jgi:anhydro-N-acetylmuramic acid kinase
MIYRAIGLMSGSSLDGLDLVFAEFQANGSKWNYEIIEADCYPYPDKWAQNLSAATSLQALDYQLLHTRYGHYLGEQVNRFMDEKNLHYKVALISSHGHTTFHVPSKQMTAQLGDGAAIAAETKLPVITDLRAMDIAFGGQGAPIVPVGEKLLLGDYDYFLNLGGIANISANKKEEPVTFIAFDVCPANRVLNMLAADAGKTFDAGGELARSGIIHEDLLNELNALDYYKLPHPKSLANNFGTDVIYPLIKNYGYSLPEAMRTYVEHIVLQVKAAIKSIERSGEDNIANEKQKLLATGGGAFNTFLMERLSAQLAAMNVEVIVPDEKLINYKEALVMALMGVLRWRQEYNVLASVTGAKRDSIGGALWIGQEA